MKILNYIKISLRTLFLHRGFSLLTLLGLSVGIAMSIFVLEYVLLQFSYDKHYDDSENIYRIVTTGQLGNDEVNAALAPMVIASELKKNTKTEAVTRVVDASEKPVQSDYSRSFESGIVFADASFFSVFSRPFIMGEAEGCLTDSSCAVISRSVSKRLFGNRNPIGEEIRINDEETYRVKGVFKDVPENSHFKYDILLPFGGVENRLKKLYGENFTKVSESWFSLVCYVYFKTAPDVDIHQFENTLNSNLEHEVRAEGEALFSNKSYADLEFNFQSLENIYLFSDYDFEIGPTANPLYVFIFLGVALFIFLVTAFNFMNLTTARALDRVREAGVRRIFGGRRKNLIVQFITESVLFSFLALFLGLVLVELLMPLFSNLFLMDFFGDGYRQHLNMPWIILITLFVGVFSGSYPAYVFSGIDAIHLQAEYKKFSSYPGLWLRGGLVLVQVFVAVLVTTTAIGMWRQLDFISKADLGFNPSDLLMVERARYLDNSVDSITDEIAGMEGVQSVSKLYSTPGDPVSVYSFHFSEDSGKVFLFSVYYIDCSLFETLQASMKSGSVICDDSTAILINEQAAHILPGDSLQGKYLNTITHRKNDVVDLKIAGVVADISLGSLKHSPRPSIFVPMRSDETPENILIRVSPGYQDEVIKQVHTKWNDANTGAPFVYNTMEEKIHSFYREDYRYGYLAAAFAILVIIISLLGVTGLVSFILATRHQNVLLRKMAGVPDYHNMIHLFSGYSLFIAIGALLSLPVSYYLLEAWAETFSIHYQTDYLCFVVPVLFITGSASIIALYGAKRLLSRMSLHQF